MAHIAMSAVKSVTYGAIEITIYYYYYYYYYQHSYNHAVRSPSSAITEFGIK